MANWKYIRKFGMFAESMKWNEPGGKTSVEVIEWIYGKIKDDLAFEDFVQDGEPGFEMQFIREDAEANTKDGDPQRTEDMCEQLLDDFYDFADEERIALG